MMKMNLKTKITIYNPNSDEDETKTVMTVMTVMTMTTMKICMTKWIQMQSQP
jgi:hypothetical protein